MKEDFLHFLWKFKKLDFTQLKTTEGCNLYIERFGTYNTLSGPDFSNAIVIIDRQYWAGTVEMHLKSSDWFAHGHEKDPAYNNVILHVVWEHDVEVFNSNNQTLPVLELKHYTSLGILNDYQKLLYHKYHFINCEKQLQHTNDFVRSSWLERLYFERLEEKSKLVKQLLKETDNNWEAVLFQMLMKSFGGNINGASFLSIAQSVNFSHVQKLFQNPVQLESVFMGQAGLLSSDIPSAYEKLLSKEYAYVKHKFGLSNTGVLPPQFFKLRPYNFPTLRLSQLAQLYHQHQQLFSLVMSLDKISDYHKVLEVQTSEFWEDHYTFQKQSKRVKKKLSSNFIQLLIINTLIPLRFSYMKYKGEEDMEKLMNLMMALPAEKNAVVAGFKSYKLNVQNALESQSLVQLYHRYCKAHKCLQCSLGVNILK